MGWGLLTKQFPFLDTSYSFPPLKHFLPNVHHHMTNLHVNLPISVMVCPCTEMQALQVQQLVSVLVTPVSPAASMALKQNCSK